MKSVLRRHDHGLRLLPLALAVVGPLVGCSLSETTPSVIRTRNASAFAVEVSPGTEGSSQGGGGTDPGGAHDPSDPSTPTTLSMNPPMASVPPGGSVTFSVVGGSAPYIWSVEKGAGVVAAGVYVAPMQPGIATIRAVDSKGRVARVSAVVPTVPNDPYFQKLYGLNNTGQVVSGTNHGTITGNAGVDINAPEAWSAVGSDCRNTIVAVIDTGYTWSHPDLADNLYTNPGEIPDNGIDDDGNGYVDDVHGWNFFNHDKHSDNDDIGHGSHCAGTIGAVGNNGAGITGVCWKARILPLRFMGIDAQTGQEGGTTSDAVEALYYARKMGAKVTSNSWGEHDAFSPDNLDNDTRALRDAIDTTGAQGTLFVVAAGNDGQDISTYYDYPGSLNRSSMVTVAATNWVDSMTSFSNYNASAGLVHVGAPGAAILSTYKGSYAFLDGTSMATPHVAGAATLLWSAYPSLTVAEVKQRLLERGDLIPGLSGRVSTGRRLNLFNLVDPNWRKP